MTQPTIILNKAASLLLEFNELSSAGYKWEVPEHKGLFIRRIENRENQNHASNQNVAIGGANKAKFSIMAEWAGDYEVTFTHKRPWSEEKAEEKVTYKIHVPKM
jgi:predicted secreted protein